MSDPRPKVALITGASSGLGAELARQVDAGWDVDQIWLVARRSERLTETAAQLARAEGVVVPADLSTAEGTRTVAERLAAMRPDLRLLVNAAGFACAGDFAAAEPEKQLQMIDVNVRALTELTHLALEHMSRGSAIVQVASVLGTVPAPGWSVYAGTKAYVIGFATSLAGELAPRGIRCVTCCPGPMRTEFYGVAGETRSMPLYVKPERVAALALRHARSGKLLSVSGLTMKLSALAARLLPRWVFIRGFRWFMGRGRRDDSG